MVRIKYVLLLFVILCSCKYTEKDRISSLVKDLYGKNILFPKELNFTLLNGDTVNYVLSDSMYRIVHYVDSTGCISCKLKLFEWKRWITKLRSDFSEDINVIFVFSNRNTKEMTDLLKREKFNYPFLLDTLDVFNHLNELPTDFSFHTFLLDKNNRVVAIGNPVHNPKIKDLYMNIIQGKAASESEGIRTKVNIKSTDLSLGAFDWQQEQTVEFILENTGERLLVINDVLTPCDCTMVGYSKEPVRPKDSVALSVTYMAEQPGRFDKIIKVYCNADSSPILLRITGEAK